MSAFQVIVTPERMKPKKINEAREPTDVVMAPFSAKAIVQFEDVPVSKTARRILRIINPTSDEIEVRVTKPVSDEHNVTISWSENVVPAQDEIQMEMVWSPQMAIACKETMQLMDNRNFRKDVMIILKAKSNKPPKGTRKFPTISSGVSSTHAKTLRLKSPKAATKPTNRLTAQIEQKKRVLKLKATSVASNGATKDQRRPWNSCVLPSSSASASTTTSYSESKSFDSGFETTTRTIIKTTSICSTQVSPLGERNRLSENCELEFSMLKTPVHGGNDKENISPLTPSNMLSLIDKLKFTPATDTKSALQMSIKLENLSSWPTPVVNDNTNTSAIYEIRPRRLTAAELNENDDTALAIPSIQITSAKAPNDDHNGSCATTPTGAQMLVSNKTFEVKREALDLTKELLDDSTSSVDGRGAGVGGDVGGVPMNKTTTVPSTPAHHHLEMIQEEECSFDIDHRIGSEDMAKLQKTYTKPPQISTSPSTSPSSNATPCESPTADLKRDIKLVGTPLRKYSESMKDLSLKSPQPKVGIQGSMPNLKDIETIRSFENNRYLHQTSMTRSSMSVIHEQSVSGANAMQKSRNTLHISPLNESSESVLNYSQASTVSQVDINFDHHEIRAQSSRFNLHEVGLKSRKSSPVVVVKEKAKASRNKATPPKSAKQLNLSKVSPSQKRSMNELSFSDAPSTESLAAAKANSKTGLVIVSPPKRLRVESDMKDVSYQRLPSVRSKSWAQVQPKKLRLAKTLSLVKKPITPRKMKSSPPRVKLYDSELYLQSCINPDPFAATTTCDPFLASTMYLDEQAVDRHQADFKKWLNALVTIPAELDTDCDKKVDVGKLFNEVRNKDLILAPTKEEQSMNYLTKIRLESLRRAAVQLFLSDSMRLPCSKVAVYVNKNSMRIRSDRNLHLDVVMQRTILELLLCFNPLWLRLGLEVVYGEKIHLHSNGDIVGLSTFILNRLFRDKFLEQKYSKAYTLSDEYADHIKKFTLQKMLFLLLFLDKAKNEHIIKHNPCLFVKQSPHKETKDILLKFSSELLANVGDISRELKRLGYVLQHKQSFLDEFDYAFHNLAVDLRDGIRLTRVMEIILLREDLSKQLRVPAISRLQRVFNVNLGLKALSEADFELKGDIGAADIVDGHREKTLSLLWQIIYKFRSPKFHAAARVIQKWWHNSWLRVVVRRRIQHKEQLKREAAATRIKAWWRGHISRRYVELYRKQRTGATVVLQKWTRVWLARKHFRAAVQCIVRLQRWYRAQRLGADYRKEFLLKRSAAVKLQNWWRLHRLSRKLLAYAAELRLQLDQRRQAAASCIQTQWRSYCQMKIARHEFVRLRTAAVVFQRRYRAKREMLKQRLSFQNLRRAVIAVQQRYRAMRQMRAEREKYSTLRQNVILMQQRRRATVQMVAARREYLRYRHCAVVIQHRWRSLLAMRSQRKIYLQIRHSACVLQQHYRARLAMKRDRAAYQKTLTTIVRIQVKWRATRLARRVRAAFISMQYYAVVVQQQFRANRQMRVERAKFQHLRSAAIILQQRRRATLEMRRQREQFQRKRRAILSLQQRFRAYKSMRLYRAKYKGIQEAVLCLQQHMRGYLQMKRERSDFRQKRQAAVVLQTTYRAHRAMLRQRQEFMDYRRAVVNVQQRYRALRQMRVMRREYQRQREIIIQMQIRFRAKLQGRQVRNEYGQTVQTIVKMQRRVRATILMRQERQKYVEERTKIVKIQRYYRNRQLMKSIRLEYEQQRTAVHTIQRWYRSVLKQRDDRKDYQRKRSSSITIQRAWRATLAGREQRQRYVQTVQKIILIQRVLRSTLHMRTERLAYEKQRNAAITMQRRYRARLVMLQIRNQYLLIRSLIICIQQKFRAKRAMIAQRHDYMLMRRTTIHLQQKFRGRHITAEQRGHFLMLRTSIVPFQACARGVLARRRYQALMTPEMVEFLRRKKAAKLIQRCWRGYRIRKRFNNIRILQIRKNIKLLKKSTTSVNTIRYKMQDAIRILRGRYGASDALQVLMCLDRISRTVPHLLMCHSDFISTFCYDIMAQTIRSEVDKQLLRYCSRIILNMARYTNTTASSFHEDGLVTVAHILLRWCDKDGEIFNTLCTLIWVFSHCPHRKQVIRKFMTTPEAIYVVRETKKLVARKEKMKQNVRKPIIAPSTRQNFSSRALPSLEPDFGVIHNKPYTFISSVYAFDTILYKLGIDIF